MYQRQVLSQPVVGILDHKATGIGPAAPFDEHAPERDQVEHRNQLAFLGELEEVGRFPCEQDDGVLIDSIPDALPEVLGNVRPENLNANV